MDFSNGALTGTYDSTGTFNATILGTVVALNYGLALDSHPDFVLNSASITATRSEWFPYARLDGTDPIYDTATGERMPGMSPFDP